MVESSRRGTTEAGDPAGVARSRALSQRFIDGSINQENGGHIEHVVQLAVDICTLALLFVEDVVRDELFAGVQQYDFFQVVCL